MSKRYIVILISVINLLFTFLFLADGFIDTKGQRPAIKAIAGRNDLIS